MNAVVKPEKIETIFDHHVTASELIELFDFEENLDDYLYALSQDSAYAHLYFLYHLRNDNDVATGYLNKIQNATYRRDVSMSCFLNS